MVARTKEQIAASKKRAEQFEKEKSLKEKEKTFTKAMQKLNTPAKLAQIDNSKNKKR